MSIFNVTQPNINDKRNRERERAEINDLSPCSEPCSRRAIDKHRPTYQWREVEEREIASLVRDDVVDGSVANQEVVIEIERQYRMIKNLTEHRKGENNR